MTLLDDLTGRYADESEEVQDQIRALINNRMLPEDERQRRAREIVAPEQHPHPATPSESPATMPPPSEPPQIAYETRILDRFKREIRWHGVVGESATAATTYLIITSRLLTKPVSEAVKGNSSSGKSHTVQTTTKFFPPEAFIEITAMSEKALVYMKDDYRHRTLIIYEAEALREYDDSLTSYFVRSLLSEGRIDYPVTVRDKDGGFTTKRIVKEGPTNLVFTTTKARVHYENETRVLSLTTDDSQDQTRRVLFELADETDHAHGLSEWLALQRWIAGGEHRVTIPYAKRLAKLVPPIDVRLRRDFGAVLSLIKTHAILHQATRDRDHDGQIVATLDDYRVVLDLIGKVISAGIGATVSDTTRETVEAVGFLSPGDNQHVTAKMLGEHLELDKSAARRRLLVAAGDDYVKNLEEKKGRPGRWVLGDPLPDDVDVLPPCHLLATIEPVAPQSEEGGGGTMAHDSYG